MYNVSKGWERFFYFSTWFTQGSSFLVPSAYGVLHRMHHEYSDTEKDPHSPHFFKDIWQMMMHTAAVFRNLRSGKNLPDPEFTKEYLPKWSLLDGVGSSMIVRIMFGISYFMIYYIYAPSAWWYLLLPIHFLMGPIHGAIVNWCGHKYGYSNFKNGDHSKNTTPWGVVMMGELFQNNHHHDKDNANFARRWFEFDMTFQIMKVLHAVRIIRLVPHAQRSAHVHNNHVKAA
ncbi:acyl-CoA desaturase [Aridibaculum aurantiacum]|uniref:acyl-CoA desaturase n=1 Tax=Aridibaculum aurantiacum TaxID=2810307 RepID=UPI001F614D96|nr:acyl-CoA desaturase [Aridibaculum aurantiacum]